MSETKFDNLMRKFQGNVYPAMLDSLGAHLGVDAKTLGSLDLGWAPIVSFKKGPNFQGWWVIPERDADGKIRGLSLRSQFDRKVMYPGSNHGLIYPLNPNHERGTVEYKNGAHNWVRPMDAGIECPVCGKPDGCLISADDVEDPKAAICIRVKDNAVKPMKFGYLHILKQEGRLVPGVSALPASEHPIIIVEGMTDVATALGLGFMAVGRPSNLAGMDMLKDLVRGRKVIIIGENDDVNPTTGQRPGHEGMLASFQVLKQTCPDSCMVLPPDHIKDFRQWVTRYNLTAEQFLEYVDEHKQTGGENECILPNRKALTLARAWLMNEHRMAGRFTLRWYADQWYKYRGTKYEQVGLKDTIRGPLYEWCDDKMVMTETKSGETKVEPLMCNRHLVNDIADAMLDDCPIKADTIPVWINGCTGPDPSDLIPFANGVLWVPKYLAGAPEDEYMLNSTPDLFNTFALPFAFDPTAKCPRWRRFLATTFDDNREKKDLLREWFGYCLTSDTSLHKLMMFHGPRRSGKSTAIAVLEGIVGREHCAAITFSRLLESFGLAGLVGKHVALMSDARLPAGSSSMKAMEILLNIVGEDPVDINRKNRDALANHRLNCRFTIATNELPQLPDHSGAMEARLNVIQFPNSFYGKEDFNLREKLIEEAPGITVWALEGLRRLRVSRRFTVPESSEESLRDWKQLTSPEASFIEECCDQGSKDFEVQRAELYEAWRGWATERGMRPVSVSVFYERVKQHVSFLSSECHTQSGRKRHIFKGLKLRNWAVKQYLGKPED